MLEMMIKFSRVGILKLSVMEKDPTNRKYWAARESLEMSYWNYLLIYFKN